MEGERLKLMDDGLHDFARRAEYEGEFQALLC
jgi:hypothetical protein